MPRRGRRREPDLMNLNLTPLLDVVLQLITFFMMLIHFGSRIEGEDRSVRLPVTPAALPSGSLGLDRLAVAIDASGRLVADGVARTGPAAAAWVADQGGERRNGGGASGGRGG